MTSQNLQLHVDNREHQVIAELQDLGTQHLVEVLDIGDFHIKRGDLPIAILERKSYADLAASLKDGRYEEQKQRLRAAQCQYKGYILEGAYPSGKHRNVPEGTFDSILVGITFRDGLIVLYSSSTAHTARLLTKLVKKLAEYASGPNRTAVEAYEEARVKSSVSTTKGDNYTPDVCYLSQLAQIPGVSHITAKGLAERYPTMAILCDELRREGGPSKLANLVISGRKLGATAEKIVRFMGVGDGPSTEEPGTDEDGLDVVAVEPKRKIAIKRRPAM